MSDTVEVITPDPAIPPESVAEYRDRRPSRLWPRVGLGAVTLISIYY